MNRIIDRIKRLKFKINLNRDFMLLSKSVVYEKVISILDKKIVVICNLSDRDGKISKPIFNIENNIDESVCKVIMNDGTSVNLYDRYLYNLIYNIKKNQYSLEEHDEYYEKIEAKND